MRRLTFLSNSPAATAAFGERIGGKLKAGGVIALTGELGCGKTLFTRGICTGLGVPPRQVNSPTFVLVNEYRGRFPVFHMDLYRIEAADALEMGIIDYLSRAGHGVIIVEWAEKILSLLPEDILKVQFQVLSARKRRLELKTTGEKYDYLFGALRKR